VIKIQHSEFNIQNSALGGAGGAEGWFLLRVAFLDRQREELATALAVADLEIRSAFVIDFGRQEELQGIISEDGAITEFDDRKPIVKHFKGRFLTFAFQDMPDDQDRLAPAFTPQVFQGALRGCRASKGLCLSTRIGSGDRHSEEIL
jgi:hypothetical protein